MAQVVNARCMVGAAIDPAELLAQAGKDQIDIGNLQALTQTRTPRTDEEWPLGITFDIPIAQVSIARQHLNGARM